MYNCTQQYMNSTYMKFNPQATLKWAAQRMHSKVIKLVMHNANTSAHNSTNSRTAVGYPAATKSAGRRNWRPNTT